MQPYFLLLRTALATVLPQADKRRYINAIKQLISNLLKPISQ